MEVYVLIIVFVLAFVCLDLNNAGKDKRDCDAIIRIALVVVLMHVAIALIGRTLPERYGYIEWAAPFGLIYGPLFYIGYLSVTGIRPGNKEINIHLFPFLLALLCYVLYLFLPLKVQQLIGFVYGRILSIAIVLSWLAYTIQIIYLISKKRKGVATALKNLLSSIVAVLLILAVLLTLMTYLQTVNGNKSSGITKSLMVYLGMLGGLVFSYRYLFRRFKEFPAGIEETSVPVLQREVSIASPKLEYQKSSLKEEVLLAYSVRVDAFIKSGTYLDIDLSLGKVATELKIPKHHLSQLFSQHYKQGFLEYINTLRISHACRVLHNLEVDVNIADLAEQCGFKSKPSFYRNFKSITGTTPTDFRSSLKPSAV